MIALLHFGEVGLADKKKAETVMPRLLLFIGVSLQQR